MRRNWNFVFFVALALVELFSPGRLLAQGREEYGLPESWVDHVRREGAVVDLSLKDAIKLALTNNLEIAIEEFNEDLNRERIINTRGFYDPVLNLRVGWSSRETPTTSILTAGAGIPINTFNQLEMNSSLEQNVPGGGAFSLSFNNNRSATNSIFNFMNPQFGSNFDLTFRQPLWRGFLQTQTERQLRIQNLNSQITESQFRRKVSEIVQQVENQYWELVFAIENHEIQRQSMHLAIVQHENNKKRVEIGVSAPIEVTSSRADVASREQEMIQAEVRIINSQNALKRMLAPDPRATIWNLTLIPTDRPQVKELQITMEQAMETALQRRPEIEEVHLRLQQNGVDREYYKKQGKPSLNLTGNTSWTGRAGRIFRDVFIDRDGDGVPETRAGREPNPGNPFFGDFGNAWSQVFGFEYFNYGVFLDIQIPLRNRSNQAQLAETGINERQLLSQLKNQQQLIIVDVRNAYESIATQKKRLEAARMARQLSQEQLEGETKRFQAGLSTNFEVLRYQRDLALTQVQELRALIDYQQALTALEKAMYTIIDSNDIALAKER